MADVPVTFTIKEAIVNEFVSMVWEKHPPPHEEIGSWTPSSCAKEYYRRDMRGRLQTYRNEKAVGATVADDDIS